MLGPYGTEVPAELVLALKTWGSRTPKTFQVLDLLLDQHETRSKLNALVAEAAQARRK